MHFVTTWPQINLQCRIKLHPKNKSLFEWFISGLPYQSIQGHAVVSGDLLYTKNIYVPKMLHAYDHLYSELLSEAAIGSVFINVSRGHVGTIMIKYSAHLTENMPYPIIGQVIKDDLPIIKKVGDTVWNGYYSSKEYYACHFQQGEQA